MWRNEGKAKETLGLSYDAAGITEVNLQAKSYTQHYWFFFLKQKCHCMVSTMVEIIECQNMGKLPQMTSFWGSQKLTMGRKILYKIYWKAASDQEVLGFPNLNFSGATPNSHMLKRKCLLQYKWRCSPGASRETVKSKGKFFLMIPSLLLVNFIRLIQNKDYLSKAICRLRSYTEHHGMVSAFVRLKYNLCGGEWWEMGVKKLDWAELFQK